MLILLCDLLTTEHKVKNKVAASREGTLWCIAGLRKDQNSKFKVWFLLNVYVVAHHQTGTSKLNYHQLGNPLHFTGKF